jgi:hypothetical protein
VKFRALATIGSFASIVGLLGGCASNPSQDVANWDIGSRPQTVISGANVPELKGLAMGSAQSKGWTIVRSSSNMIVMQRQLDPSSPSAAALGLAGTGASGTIEVTSAFIEQPDGVKVGLGAELVSQSSSGQGGKRVDYTETYRDSLVQSLDSLKATWAANHHRIANAMPPLPGPSESAPAPGSGEANANPMVKAWSEAVTSDSKPSSQTSSGPTTIEQPTASSTRRAAETEPPAPAPETQTWRAPAAPARSVPAEPAASSGGAPVVDGGGSLSASAGATSAVGPRRSEPPEPVATENNMLALGQSSGAGAWAYYAEQYARLRGCQVSEQGSTLIESRSDGEVHKVSCIGSDSFLLKCQNGVCRSLQ